MRNISQKALADAFLGDYPQNLSKYITYVHYMDSSGRCLTVFVAIETALTIGQADMLRE